MSLQALAWAIEYQDLPRDERSGRIKSSCKLVLQALANFAGPGGGDCFPAVETIVYHTGLSERAVQLALRELTEYGTIAETADPLVRASTIHRPDKRPRSYDLLAFQRARQGVHERGARSTSGVQSQGERGARSQSDSPDTGCKVSGDLAPDPVIEPVEANCNLEEHPKDTVTADAPTLFDSDHDEPARVKQDQPPPSSRQRSSPQRSPAEIDTLFIEWWTTYPRKVAKIKAKEAWNRAAKLADPRELINAAARYAQQQADPWLRQFTKHPATWLNGGCWEDEPEPVSTNGNGHRNGYEPYRNPTDPHAYDGPLR